MAPRGIEKNMKALSEAGIRVAAISVDKPEKTREMMVQKAGYTFTFLSDPKLEVIRRYDLVRPEELASGKDIARPAEFRIDPSGTIRWRMVSENFLLRARTEHVLEAVCLGGIILPLASHQVRERSAMETSKRVRAVVGN